MCTYRIIGINETELFARYSQPASQPASQCSYLPGMLGLPVLLLLAAVASPCAPAAAPSGAPRPPPSRRGWAAAERTLPRVSVSLHLPSECRSLSLIPPAVRSGSPPLTPLPGSGTARAVGIQRWRVVRRRSAHDLVGFRSSLVDPDVEPPDYQAVTLLQPEPETNLMRDYAFIRYCDGWSFAGNRGLVVAGHQRVHQGCIERDRLACGVPSST